MLPTDETAAEMEAAMTADRATERQVAFARKLIAERQAPEGMDASLIHPELLSKRDASTFIDVLLSWPKRPATAPEDVEEGFYVVGTHVAKVQRAIHGSGHLYAKRLTEEGWVFWPRALPIVAREGRRMTAEEAGEYGRLYGFCIACGATLTDEESIARGIGPICATKF